MGKFLQKIKSFVKNKPLEESPKGLLSILHKKYGKIYMPYYNKDVEIFPDEHDIYNENGERMRTFFIRDMHLAHAPFYCDSKYFIWDRFNIGLKTHFYTHEAMLETMGKPDYRLGMFVESPAVVPSSYELFDRYPGLEKDFDFVFTYSYDLLEKIPNARFVPFGAEVWDQDSIWGDAYLHKTKDISFLSSNKLMCDLHRFRYDLAHFCKSRAIADTFGTFDGGQYVEKLTNVLNEYRFTICIENDISPYYFSERFTTALACQTIPIYLGASKIDEFFNPDGIIKITTSDDIEKVLKRCTKEEYESRLPAVLDNYKRVQRYYNISDYMYEEYLEALFKENGW